MLSLLRGQGSHGREGEEVNGEKLLVAYFSVGRIDQERMENHDMIFISFTDIR